MTLKTIIGNNYFTQIPTKDRKNLELAIKNTFRRYAYEWLDSNLNIELKLNSINILSENQAVLLVDRSQKIIPRIDLKLYVHKGSNGWKVYDFGIWNFRYTQMKRRKYLAFIRNYDLDGLKNFLEQKIINFLINIFLFLKSVDNPGSYVVFSFLNSYSLLFYFLEIGDSDV